MSLNINEVEQLIEEGESLRAIAQAYSEIANLKIKRIRQETEKNRVFFEEIAKIYGLVKNLAVRNKVDTTKSKKTVSIILTSNYRFYGSINSDLLDFFTLYTKNLVTDKIALGRAAIDYFRVSKKFPDIKEILLKDDQPTPSELNSVANILKDYSQVFVFHPKLKSLLVQIPTVTEITASAAIGTTSQEEVEKFKFIFEPELGKILSFFDSSIITLLLSGTFLESELARTASRFISMDNAESEANKFINENQKLKAFAKRNLINKEVLDSFASQFLFRREEKGLNGL